MINEIPYPILTEAELKNLFQEDSRKKLMNSLDKSRYFLICGLFFLILFIVSNFGAIKSSLTYQRPAKIIPPEKKAYAVELPQNQNSQSSVLKNNETDMMANNDLYIPSLEIKAPIIWQTAFEEKTIQKNLEQGIVHLAGTAEAGEIGNVVITGHSSYFSWAKGDYKTIFARLSKIKLADRVYIIRGGTLYIYQVKNIYEVSPDQIEVMSLGENSKLTLITCTPIGTASRRLIVEAEQIGPDPNLNQAFTGQPIKINQDIPAVR